MSIVSIGGQHPLSRPNLLPFSSTVGLACVSSPFNDALPQINNSPIHPNWMPHNPHHSCIRGALSNTKWPVVQPVFLPVERSDVHFQRGCHHHPPPCHMNVYNCCTHISHCSSSSSPKRPRLEGNQLLPMPQNRTIKSAFKASFQTSQFYETALRRTRSPPPLVKTSQNGCHHRTPEVPHSGTEKREASKARSTTVTVSRNVSPVHSNDSVKCSIKNGDEAVGSHSTTLRESSATLCKDSAQCSSATRFSKRGYSSVADKKSNTIGEQQRKVDNEIEQRINNGEKVCSEKHCRCKQLNTPDKTKESYSIRSEEQPEHFISAFKPCGEALHCRTTQKQSFPKRKEDIFVSWEDNQNGKHQSCNANVNHYTSVSKSCSLPQSSPDIPRRRQSIPQHYHTLSVVPGDYEEERPVKTRDSFHERATSEENLNYPAISPKGYQKWCTGLYNNSYQNMRFSNVPGDEIAPSHQTPKVADDQRCDNSPFNSQALHSRLQSKVPQLRRGRPRTKGLKDNSPGYNDALACSPTNRQSHLSKVILCDTPQCEHSMQSNDSDVFSVSSTSDINNSSATARDKTRHQPFVPKDTTAISVKRFENEHQIRRQTVDQPRKTISLGDPHNPNANLSITSHDQQYQKTHNIENIDRNRDQMVSSMQHQDLFRNHYQKPPSLSVVNTPNANTSCNAPKRNSLLAPSTDSTKFVTNLNELLKLRTASSQRQHKSNDFLFDETQRQDAAQSRHKPVGIQSSQCPEKKQESTICQSKWNAKTNLEDDKNQRRNTARFPNEAPEVHSSDRHLAKGEPGRSVALILARPNCEEIDSRDYKAMTSNNSGNQEPYIVKNDVLSEQSADTSKAQPCCPSSRAIPLPPAEDDLDNMDGGCGGYAIDHSSLPKIVAVHSIVKRDEAVPEDECTLFSASDKKYWNDLLKKLTSELSDSHGEMERQHCKSETTSQMSETSTFGRSKDTDARNQNKVSPDSSMQPESLNNAKMNDNISQFAMWEYLSSPSTNLTVNVRNPTDYAETEKKSPSPRKKPTVAELSEKILVTRERIKQETIPWKKKLLYSLEAIFIKRLRKTEKETGQKANISLDEEKAKEESKEKRNGQKERRYSQAGKEKIAGPRHKQTTKKKL